MKLNHLALNIIDFDEIQSFYINVLGFKHEYDFRIQPDISLKIFGLKKEINVYKISHNNIFIELFLVPDSSFTGNNGFAHICFESKNREKILTNASNGGYHATTIIRENHPNLTFIKDKAGNLFEIKDQS